MPAIHEVHGCIGLLLRLNPGNELIVYAHRLMPSAVNYHPIVGSTLLVREAKYIGALGLGSKPRKQ